MVAEEAANPRVSPNEGVSNNNGENGCTTNTEKECIEKLLNGSATGVATLGVSS